MIRSRSLNRAVLVVAIGAILAGTLSSCISSPTASVANSTNNGSTPTLARGSVWTQVTSVDGVLLPYNPMEGDQGIPAEGVDFVIHNPGHFPLTCVVQVLHNGMIVGTSQVGVGPYVVNGGAWPSVDGSTFSGTPADAKVRCKPQSTVSGAPASLIPKGAHGPTSVS